MNTGEIEQYRRKTLTIEPAMEVWMELSPLSFKKKIGKKTLENSTTLGKKSTKQVRIL